MDFKAVFQNILNELVQKDRIIAFALGLILSVIAAVTHLPSDKVHDLVCGAPAVAASPALAPVAPAPVPAAPAK